MLINYFYPINLLYPMYEAKITNQINMTNHITYTQKWALFIYE